MTATAETARTSPLPIDPMFLDRWSPRAFRKDPLPAREVETLFEAARWAPSASNQQPWMFLYADDEAGLARLRPVLVEFNRAWADQAPLLTVVFARTRNEKGEENRWAPFDAGAAWMSLALQARKLGLYAHAMGGFDEEKVYEALGVDRTQWRAMTVVAVGRHGDPTALSAKLQARESPSQRKPLAEVARRVV